LRDNSVPCVKNIACDSRISPLVCVKYAMQINLSTCTPPLDNESSHYMKTYILGLHLSSGDWKCVAERRKEKMLQFTLNI
jgi:hypothetical protein